MICLSFININLNMRINFMEKFITVYIVKQNDVEKVYPTKAQALRVLDTLSNYGHTAELEQTKRKVTLA